MADEWCCAKAARMAAEMDAWSPESGPFPKPPWVPRKLRDAQYWWDLTCWQRNEISRLKAELDLAVQGLNAYVAAVARETARAEAAEARIAAAHRVCDHFANLHETAPIFEVRRALTEGTGQ